MVYEYETSESKFKTEFENGTISFDQMTGQYEVLRYFKDHLGSVRVLLQNGRPAAFNEYEPFGRFDQGYSCDHFRNVTFPAAKNKFMFNGKEEMLGRDIGMLDFGARLYDPTIARWNSVEPLAEWYEEESPYNFCLNNPISLIDPYGLNPEESSSGFWGRVPGGYWAGFTCYIDPIEVVATSIIRERPVDSVADKVNFQWTQTLYGISGLGYNATSLAGNSTALAGAVLEIQKSSIRLTNGIANGDKFSPKFYKSGWGGGSKAGIKTYRINKIGTSLSKLSSKLGWIGLFPAGMQVGVGIINQNKQQINNSVKNLIVAGIGISIGALMTGIPGAIVAIAASYVIGRLYDNK